jgi:hypothetical protein
MPSNDYVNTVRNNTGKKLFSVRSAPSLYQPQLDVEQQFVLRACRKSFVKSFCSESSLEEFLWKAVCNRVCGCRPTRVVLGGILVCEIVSCVNVTQWTDCKCKVVNKTN